MYARIILLSLVALGTTFLLSACDQPDAAEEKITSDVESMDQSDVNPSYLSESADIKASRPWKIAYIIKADEEGNPYWSRIRYGAGQAAEDFGVSVEVMVPHKQSYNVPLQVSLVEQLTQSDIDGMVIIPIDTNILAAPVERFVASGKPVIIHDTPLNTDVALTQLAFDNQRAGLLIGRWINQQLNGHGRVLVMEGQLESQNAIERRNGILEGLAEGEIEVLDMKSSNWKRSEAYKIAANWLNEYQEIDAILTSNDASALGVLGAIAAAGRSGIMVTGVDASPEALEAIRQGRMHATVEQAPERQARQAVQLLIRHLERNETYPKISVWKESPLITINNVEKYLR